MKLTVIGTGYVGLVSGTCFAELGFNVTCVDRDNAKIEALTRGEIPIYEPGLDALVIKNASKLSFTTDLAKAVSAADIVLVAVGTPEGKDGMPDMTQLNSAVAEIAKAISKYTLVVIKSTVPVGTTALARQTIATQNPSAQFDVAFNPEFLREGMAISDFMTPDRIVAGADSAKAKTLIEALYSSLTSKDIPLMFTTFESAEMIKYTANSLLATRIAFINEMADICEQVGADIGEVARGVGLDKRIGDKFLQPGPGAGGSCFPKDTMALKHIARGAGVPSSIVEASVASNTQRKRRMAEKTIAAAGGAVRGKTIAVLGLTFKPGTDDMRESASLVILPSLIGAGARIRAFDPQGMKEAAKLLSGPIDWCSDAYDALNGADMALILTEWNEFKTLDLAKVKAQLKTPLVVDLRNIFARADMEEHGFTYVSIGRQDVRAKNTKEKAA